MLDNIKKYIVEFIGTFIFLSVIITYGEAIPIGVALACLVYWGGKVSGANFNPAVTLMLLFGGKLKTVDAIFYIVFQVLGAVAALLYFKQFIPSKKN